MNGPGRRHGLRTGVGGLLYLAVVVGAVAALFAWVELPEGCRKGEVRPSTRQEFSTLPLALLLSWGGPALAVVLAGVAGVLRAQGGRGLRETAAFLVSYRTRDEALVRRCLPVAERWMLLAGVGLGLISVAIQPRVLPLGRVVWMGAPVAGLVLGRLWVGGLVDALTWKLSVQEEAGSSGPARRYDLALVGLLPPLLCFVRMFLPYPRGPG